MNSTNSTVLLLLVEDDDLIRMMLEDTLTAAGFELVIASNGKEALAKFDADPGRFRGVVTDITLGRDPDGWEVARHARELDAEMAVVYITAGRGHEWASKGVPKSVLLSKPFVGAQIVTAISTMLNEAGES